MSLKYLSKFWKSLEMPLISCKVELKPRWMKHCVLALAGVENDVADSNNIIFTIKDTKLYVPVATLSAKENQELLILPSIVFERSVNWNKYKTKSENKNTTNKYRYFLKTKFVGVNRLPVLFYLNRENDIMIQTSEILLSKIYYNKL